MLLLFDIDGTLLAGATDAHREALHAALLEVHGVDARNAPPIVAPAGRTDPEIARLILLDHGVSAARIETLADEVREVCCRTYAQLSTADLSHTVLPGVRELLDWLDARDDFQLGLLTGNYEPVARVKLTRAGLGPYFRSGVGAFGSDSEDRAALPAIARRRAGSRREDTIVIGDTPRDIACARADGVGCIAIASGPYTAEQLAGADHVVGDALALKEVLTA
jgi:phosphoglycolate phosphatase-like HAD superfamily hydrolase